MNLFTKKFPKGPPSIQPEINPNVAAANATSLAATAPALTASGANDAAFPCPPVIGILPVIIEINGSTFINLPTANATPFWKAANTAAKIANIRTNFPPFFKSAILAAAPLAAKNIQ